jgi:argininosuccinate lyase
MALNDMVVKQVHGEQMQQALTMDVLATDLADYLVRKGVRILVDSQSLRIDD